MTRTRWIAAGAVLASLIAGLSLAAAERAIADGQTVVSTDAASGDRYIVTVRDQRVVQAERVTRAGVRSALALMSPTPSPRSGDVQCTAPAVRTCYEDKVTKKQICFCKAPGGGGGSITGTLTLIAD